MEPALLVRESSSLGNVTNIMWSRYSAPDRRVKEPAFDFRIDADSRLLNASTPAYSKLSGQSPLMREEGLLRPSDSTFDAEWFDALNSAMLESGPQICRIARKPKAMHACMQQVSNSGDVLVTLEADVLCEQSVFDMYALRYSLTCSERRILWKLSLGLEPKRIAFAQDISESTVRTHIKAILAKTGEPTIRHLVIRLARLPQLGLENAA